MPYTDDRERFRARSIEQNLRDAIPVQLELAAAGYPSEHIGDMPALYPSYVEALPILLKWLHELDNPYVKTAVVRALSVPWARPAAIEPLIREFLRVPLHQQGRNFLKWTIGNALDVVADDSAFKEMAALAADPAHGDARQMIIAWLGRRPKKHRSRAIEVLVKLLSDDDATAGRAIGALRRLRAIETRAGVERFVNHEKDWLRNAAKKALARFDDIEAMERSRSPLKVTRTKRRAARNADSDRET